LVVVIKHIPNHIIDVMIRVLSSIAIDCGFKARSGETKDLNIGICFFSTKHAALMRKSKDRLARNQRVGHHVYLRTCLSDLAL